MWIDIKGQVPEMHYMIGEPNEHSETVLVAYSGGQIHTGFMFADKTWNIPRVGGVATHWMSLPKHPDAD